MSTPADQFHHRLSNVENQITRMRRNPAPTIPKYDLSVPSSIYPLSRHAFNVTDAGSATGNGKGMAISGPCYIEIEWFMQPIAFSTIDNHEGFTGALLVLANSDINSTGGPAEGIYISSDIAGTSTFTSSPNPANWAYNTEDTSHASLITPTFDSSIIHKEILHYDGSNFSFTMDGISIFSFTKPFTPDRYYIGAIYGTGLGGNVGYNIASLKVGTTLGGSDIFSTDFSTMPTWDYSLSSAATFSFTQVDSAGHYTVP